MFGWLSGSPEKTVLGMVERALGLESSCSRPAKRKDFQRAFLY